MRADPWGAASHAIAREDHCLSLPDNLSTEQGAALPEALLTVWYNVMERGQLSAGETVLIHRGSGGIGSIGIQMAGAWRDRDIHCGFSGEM